MNHPDQRELVLYTLGELYPMRTAEIEAHVETCDDCAASLQREAQVDQALHVAANNLDACPGCDRRVITERCDHCGAANRVAEYRILEVRVQNQHGRLYLAEDDSNRVALKELCFMQAPSFEALDAFEREARILCALDHRSMPKFVKSFQHGEGVHTRLYLAQEFIEGVSLEEKLANHYFDETEALSIARQVLHILVFLQQRSPMVIHRDVKPANLIARPDGSIVLVDFGAARDQGSTAGATQVGTFGYMPVEQLAGIVDASTDVYALGVSLARLLTRREAWKITDESWGKMNISAPLRRVLQRMMARKPEDRFPSAPAALAAFDALERPRPKRNVPVWAATALASAVVAGGTVVAYRIATTPAEQAPAYKPLAHRPIVEPVEVAPKPTFEPRCSDAPLARRSSLLEVAHTLQDSAQRRHWDKLVSLVRAYRGVVEGDDAPYVLAIIDRLMVEPQGHVHRGANVGSTIFERVQVIEGDAVVSLVENSLVVTTGSLRVNGRIKNSLVISGGCVDNEGIVSSLVISGASVGVTSDDADDALITSSIVAAPMVRAADAPMSKILGGIWLDEPGSFKERAWEPVLDALLAAERTPGPTDCDEVSCILSNYDGACCAEYRPSPSAVGKPRVGEHGFAYVTSNLAAKISIDGTETGLTTPAKITLSPGRHKIGFTYKTGFTYGNTKSAFPIVIKPNETINFHKDLE